MQLLFFMDGLRYDLCYKDMPFLSSMNVLPLESEYGYSCACHASMYTGKYVEDHNTWFVWKKGSNSPYKFINYVPGLKYLNFIPVKMILSRIARVINKNTSYPGIPMLVNLPLKYWSLFEPCEDVFWDDDRYMEGKTTLFKFMKENGIRFTSVGLNKQGDVFDAAPKVDYSKYDVVYFFIGQVDGYMHRYGEFQEESHRFLREVDNFIKGEFAKAKKITDDITLIAWSDHGHINVTEHVNINDYFKPMGLNVNNYIHLIESTFARFWFKSEKERNEVTRVLKVMEEKKLGFIFTKEIFNRWHLNFNNNEHGDLIFYLNAPRTFTNTIWGFGHRYVSMHGYLPTEEKHTGIFASNKRFKNDKNLATLVDLMPTIAYDLGIDDEKYGFVGRNLLE